MRSTSYTSRQRENALGRLDGSGQLGISLHAWPCYGMVNIDVFSCEEFSPEEVVRFASHVFQARDVELNVVERATRSPRLATSRVDSGALYTYPERTAS